MLRKTRANCSKAELGETGKVSQTEFPRTVRVADVQTNMRSDIENPAEAGFLKLPALTTIPVVDVFLGLVLRIAIALLDFALQLLALAIDDIKIVVGEFAPLLLNLALHLFPVTFYAVPIH